MKKLFKTTFIVLCLSAGFFISNNLYGGCGMEVKDNCVTVYADYQSGTNLPCLGNCGGCMTWQCGPVVKSKKAER